MKENKESGTDLSRIGYCNILVTVSKTLSESKRQEIVKVVLSSMERGSRLISTDGLSADSTNRGG